MKFKKCCPKCQSDDILKLPVNYGDNAGSNAVMISLFKKGTPVTRFLCCNCGFIEDWIDNPQHIEVIKKDYLKHNK